MLLILCVDANENDAEMIRRIILKSPLDTPEFVVAPTIREAVHFSAARRPDIVLMDLDLRDDRGPGVFTKYHSVFESVPVIVVTGAFKADVAQQVMDAGAYSFIEKGDINLRSHRLYTEIEQALKKNRKRLGDL